MKHNLNRVILLLIVLTLLAFSKSYSQNLTGIWRGYFITESSDQYKFELQIDHKRGALSGVSYSYLTTVFYGKATLTGNFSNSSQNVLIQEIRTVELKMGPGSSACIMKCSFQYVRSGKEEFLEGTFTSKFEKNGYASKKGDNCGSGKVYLRKVQSSDFYIEPFLRNKIASRDPEKSDVAKTNPPVVKKPATSAPNNNSTVKKPVVKPNTAITPKSNTAKTKTNTGSPTAKTKPSLKQDNAPVTIDSTPDETVTKNDPVIKKQQLPTPPVMKLRENNLVQTITSDAENVSIKIFDNGEIDDDTISVYLDKQLVLSRQRLSAAPLIVNVKMNEDNAVHELVMVADNLGRIPPNTSLMVVMAGDKRYEVRITSNEQRNAVVRFVYRKPE